MCMFTTNTSDCRALQDAQGLVPILKNLMREAVEGSSSDGSAGGGGSEPAQSLSLSLDLVHHLQGLSAKCLGQKQGVIRRDKATP